MSCRPRQALATGHEEIQSTATGQKNKFAAAGDNEQAIAETPSSGISKGPLKDMPRDCYSSQSLSMRPRNCRGRLLVRVESLVVRKKPLQTKAASDGD